MIGSLLKKQQTLANMAAKKGISKIEARVAQELAKFQIISA